jgi:negative regulator of sigma E activity
VLRSDELSCHADGFNVRFAAKLAAEAHVFAPRAARAIAARQAELHRSRWIKPASLVASMAAVAVVAGVAMQQWRGTMNSDVNTAMSAQSVVAPVIQKASVDTTNQMAQASLPSVYLAAHRQFASQRTALYVQTVAHDSEK